MPWWGWLVIGALLLGAELFVVEADFFLVFLGVSAILTGLFALTVPTVPYWAQWLVFAGVALVSMAFFRKRVYHALRRNIPPMADDLLGQQLDLPVELPADATCRVEHRGSTWTARNVGATAIAVGTRARVVRVDGITLHVEAH